MSKGKDRIEPITLVLTKEECHCPLIEFYGNVARILGYDTEKVRYNREAIIVTEAVRKEIESYYREQGTSASEFNVGWACFGPKTGLQLNLYNAYVAEGFIVKD